MSTDEIQKFLRELHDRERQVLFGNEAFVIGMLQTVSTAAVIGVFAQIEKLDALVDRWAILVFLSAALLCLALSVAAAFFRHQYKMWDVKAAVAASAERERRIRRTHAYLRAMRAFMCIATALLAGGLIVMIGAMWNVVCPYS